MATPETPPQRAGHADHVPRPCPRAPDRAPLGRLADERDRHHQRAIPGVGVAAGEGYAEPLQERGHPLVEPLGNRDRRPSGQGDRDEGRDRHPRHRRDVRKVDRQGLVSDLDRADFGLGAVRGLSAADGAATLTAFTAATVAQALQHVAERPARLLVTGGGRHNTTLMTMLAARTGVAVATVEAVGWNGDALEAEAFAYLAVRVMRELPTSWPETTGVAVPTVGGVVDRVFPNSSPRA